MGGQRWRGLCVFGLALLLALIQVHHILLFYAASLNANIDAAIGVTTGHPHWRVYQNRVLGPYLLKGLAGLFSGDYAGAYTALMIAFLALAGYQAWRIGRKVGGDQVGWFALVVLHLAFTFLFAKTWLYLWDLIGLSVFLAFVDLIIHEKPWYWFGALFVVAILNRDSGQLIALWMILEPVCRWLTRRPLSRQVSATMMTAGVLCIAAGQWMIDYLRTSLLVEEVGFGIAGGTPSGYGPDYFWNLPNNMALLQHILQADSLVNFVTIFLPLAMVMVSVFFVATIIYKERRYLALALTFAASLVSLLLFASLTETRVFIELIPLLMLGSCLLIHPGCVQNQNNKGPI